MSADRGYGYKSHRCQLRRRGITPEIARRGTDHGSGLGRHLWVVERTFAWLHQFRRLLVRYDRRYEIHEAFLALTSCLVCFRRLQNSSQDSRLPKRPSGSAQIKGRAPVS